MSFTSTDLLYCQNYNRYENNTFESIPASRKSDTQLATGAKYFMGACIKLRRRFLSTVRWHVQSTELTEA